MNMRLEKLGAEMCFLSCYFGPASISAYNTFLFNFRAPKMLQCGVHDLGKALLAVFLFTF